MSISSVVRNNSNKKKKEDKAAHPCVNGVTQRSLAVLPKYSAEMGKPAARTTISAAAVHQSGLCDGVAGQKPLGVKGMKQAACQFYRQNLKD